MDLSLLATLKTNLAEAEDFTETVNFFFDHFGVSPDFIALGQQVHDRFLETVVLQVGAQLFKGPVVVADLLMTRLAEHQFIHGGGRLNGRLDHPVLLRGHPSGAAHRRHVERQHADGALYREPAPTTARAVRELKPREP